MISTNQFKNGAHVEIEGTIYRIVDFQHVKPGKGGAFVRTKLRRVEDGSVMDKTFRAGEKFRPVRTETKRMQYLYDSGEAAVLMDTDTYEQTEISRQTAGEDMKWLRPNDTVDVLNAVTTMQRYGNADPNRIGMWGHSMGGNITLRALVIDPRIKVAVIWAGVNATYKNLMENWHPVGGERVAPSFAGGQRQDYLSHFGTPEQNPGFWDSISPMSYLADITAPIQLDHGTADTEVPLQFSQTLARDLQAAGKPVELYSYPGSDHNIAQGFTLAMARSVAFFDRNLKG